jgi:uncharacterized flavoprotein (TIGR03862 family)
MNIAIVGGGPAGMRAAEIAASGGAAVTLFDSKPSVGRKFLVAGKGGLNLAMAEPPEDCARHFSGPAERWASLIAEFDCDALRAWAAGLGVETFVASTGRVYPCGLKAAPLLRAWVRRLRELGVRFAMNQRWTGLSAGSSLLLEFSSDGGPRHSARADAVVLAMGGGSWPQTGSDGAWTSIMESLGVRVLPLQPANCGWELAWPASVLARAEGKPLKNIVASAGGAQATGELLITEYGLEGSLLYRLGPELRSMAEPTLTLDLKPGFSTERLVSKLGALKPNSAKLLEEARTRWRLSDAAFAILESRGPFASAASMAGEAGRCGVRLTGPRPLAEAISSAGGVCWSELSDGLMLHRIPGVFLAGELIDWEAPTGGYLIHGCLATGDRAARGALTWRH